MGGIEPPVRCFGVCGARVGKCLDFPLKSRFFCLALNGPKIPLYDVARVSRDTHLKSRSRGAALAGGCLDTLPRPGHVLDADVGG